MANVTNLLVGVGRLLVKFPADPTWSDVGFTTEGVELAFEPDYGTIEVDQLKDAAKMFNQSLTVTLRTNLAEATVENLAIAWGYGANDAYGDPVITTTGTGAAAVKTFRMGIPLDEPVERMVRVEGKAPGTQADGRPVLREYTANRAVSVEGSTLALRKTEATVFPTSFRLLPDPSESGQEYGTIVDYVGTAA